VADGVGGAAAGEVASRIFTETATQVFSIARRQSEQDTADSVLETFRLANERILKEATEDIQYQGMGCTAELIVFDNQNYALGHVGDSRTYLYRQGQLKQMTKDHTFIQDQIDQGIITPAEANGHSHRNVILRAVGANETLAVDLIEGESLPGDIFLLCSDGLTDMTDETSIQDVLALSLSLDQKGDRLVELAKSKGGYDNITVVLCEIVP
jgi:serine/threonine protein phosphatase PrpC